MMWVCIANWLETVDLARVLQVKAIRDALGYPETPLELEHYTLNLTLSCTAGGILLTSAVRRHVRTLTLGDNALVPMDMQFPRLQSLRLHDLVISQASWARLIAACPALTKLHVDPQTGIGIAPLEPLLGREWHELCMPTLPCTREQMVSLISPVTTHLVVESTDYGHHWTLPELEKAIAKWQGKTDRVRQLALGGKLVSHDVLLRAVEAFPNLETWPWPKREDWLQTLDRFQWPHPMVLQPLYNGWGFIDTFPPFADECNAYIYDWIWLDVVRTSKRPLRKIRLLGSDVLSYDWKKQDVEALMQSSTSWESVFLHGSRHFSCSGAIVDHLVKCPRLRTMTLNLSMLLTDELLLTLAVHPTLEEIYLDHYHTDPPRPTATVKVESLEKLILGRKTVRLECCNLDGLGVAEHKRLQAAQASSPDNRVVTYWTRQQKADCFNVSSWQNGWMFARIYKYP